MSLSQCVNSWWRSDVMGHSRLMRWGSASHDVRNALKADARGARDRPNQRGRCQSAFVEMTVERTGHVTGAASIFVQRTSFRTCETCRTELGRSTIGVRPLHISPV